MYGSIQIHVTAGLPLEVAPLIIVSNLLTNSALDRFGWALVCLGPVTLPSVVMTLGVTDRAL